VEQELLWVKKHEFSVIPFLHYEIVFINREFEEIIFPSIWEQQTFTNKIGEENSNMMWRFRDKGDREICLIPEVTALAQEMWNKEWYKTNKNKKLFYVQRCYRYERPQLGRYREFTQFGCEYLGATDTELVKETLKECLDKFNIKYEFNDSVKRGLTYYVEDGFECSVTTLGAQAQIAGGGKYREGSGWAIGIDRLVLAILNSDCS
jgi:histidyl-tRNA synthetase